MPDVVWWPANIIEMNMPGHLVGAGTRSVPSSFVDRHQHVEQVALVVGRRRPGGPAVHDPLDQLDQLGPGRVAPVEALDVGVGVDVGDGVGALLEVVVERGEPPVELLPEALPIRQADDV